MKAGKLAIRPWLSCPYNEDRLVDLPSSVSKSDSSLIKGYYSIFKIDLELGLQKLGTLFEKKYVQNQSLHKMLIIKSFNPI